MFGRVGESADNALDRLSVAIGEKVGCTGRQAERRLRRRATVRERGATFAGTNRSVLACLE
jgi:hypothetical protein